MEVLTRFNYMVITPKGEKYRHYKYEWAKDYLERNGGRLYAYADVTLKRRVRLLLEQV